MKDRQEEALSGWGVSQRKNREETGHPGCEGQDSVQNDPGLLAWSNTVDDKAVNRDGEMPRAGKSKEHTAGLRKELCFKENLSINTPSQKRADEKSRSGRRRIRSASGLWIQEDKCLGINETCNTCSHLTCD